MENQNNTNSISLERFKKNWEFWKSCHEETDQQKRCSSAESSKCTPIFVDETNGTGNFQGSSGHHTTTLESCSCIDFNRRRKPCKHMYRLAMELNIMPGNIKSNTKDISRVRPKSGIKIADAVSTIESFTKEEKELLHNILYMMKYTYHSEYAPVSKECERHLQTLVNAGILQIEEQSNIDFMLASYSRNELNSRIAASNIDIKYKKNMKLADLIIWCKDTLSQAQLKEVCSDKLLVSITTPYLKSKHKMYLYLHRIEELQGSSVSFSLFGDNEPLTADALPDDDVTQLLQKHGYIN